jgi:hypothetical protein
MWFVYTDIIILIFVLQKDLPRKKRRRLEAQREMLEDEDEDDEEAKVRFFELFCYLPLLIANYPHEFDASNL